MVLIKQSTAIEWDFFAMDANGDGVTGVADGSWTKRIKKSAGAFAAMTVTITELENGWYKCTFSSAHTDTLGCLSISFSATGVKRVNLQFLVRIRATDDLAFPAVSGRATAVDVSGRVDVGAVLGTAQTAGDIMGARAEPAAGAPLASASTQTKVDWLYSLAINEWVGDGSTQVVKKNDGSGDLAKQTTGASGGTTTMGKLTAP